MENAVSAELVHYSFREAATAIEALKSANADLLPGYRVKFLDGNHLSGTKHRIKELCNTWAATLPGKALVVVDQRHVLIENVFATHPQTGQKLEVRRITIELKSKTRNGDNVNPEKYKKHRRGSKKKPLQKTPYKNGSHVATSKILAQRKAR